MSALIVARSCYSFGFGVEEPAALVSALPGNAAGMVLADAGGLYGHPDFQAAASAGGIAAGSGVRFDPAMAGIVFLALGDGWSELSGLVTRIGFRDRGVQGADTPPDVLRGTERLAALVFRPADAATLRECGFEGEVHGAVMPGAFGKPPGEAEHSFVSCGIPPVACWPVVFTGRDSMHAHRLIRAVSLESAEASLPSRAFASPAARMPSRGELAEAFEPVPASQRGALDLAGRMETFRPADGLLLSGSDAENASKLRALARERFEAVYGRAPAASRRLESELGSIAEAGLAGYFLAFHDVTEFCSDKGITVSARGSAAGSIVSYLLGISRVCPMRCGLSFSRFFNRLRPDPPDIDLDIDSLERDRVVAYVLQRWGDRAACVSEIVRHRRRSAFRTAAGAAGLSPADVDSMSVLLDDREAAVWRREPGRRLLSDAGLIEGLPSHLAPHPCGLVIAPGPIRDVVPLEPGASGQALTQFDLEGVEKAGLLKMDLLGQRGLSAISLAARWSGRPDGGSTGRVLDLPGDLSAALDLLAGGRTIGVTHVESPALRGLLREMRVSSLDDVARALALVRPGASGNGSRERFFAARRGESPVVWEFDELREILGGNLGEMLYEEDVSDCAGKLIGLDPAEADLMRRRLKKRSLVVEDIESRGMGREEAGRIHSFLSRFAGYGFCRAHAYSYAAVACVSAAMKVERPACFMAAVLAGGGGFYDQRTYVEEARRLGLRTMPPGVNTGEWTARPVGDSVMLGFSSLRGMGPSEFASLQRGRPYAHPSEVVQAGVGRQVVKSMALAGCFEETGMTRSVALWSTNSAPGGFFSREDLGLPEIPEHCESERVALDLRLLGAAVSRNPLSLVGRPGDTVPLDRRPPAGRYTVWGRVASRRSLDAGAGFLMVEDDRGYADVFLPSPLYRMARLAMRRDGATLVLEVSAGRDGRLRASSVSAGPLTPCAMVV